MTGTLSRPKNGNLAHPLEFFIDGAWVRPSSDRKFTVINPADEEAFLEVAEAVTADAIRAVEAARRAFDEGAWPRMSHDERAGYLRRLAAGIRERNADLADLWSREMGVINSAALPMTSGIADVFDRHADLAGTFPFIEFRKPEYGAIGMLVKEPVGVVLAIIPWNAPLSLLSHKIAPALLAGCTVIVKASPEAPGEALAFAELVEAAGLPSGVVNVLTADRAVSEELVRNPEVDKVSFTGSTAAGRRIASLCGERIARFTLELGGKSAAVILNDYDVEAAAASIAATARLMTGQVCSSLTRIIVSQHRHDALVEALSAAFGGTRVGDPFDPSSEMGPLAMKRQLDRVEMLVAQGVSEGAVLAAGGARPLNQSRGFYFSPTVLANVDNHSTVAREEIFGPVLSVIPARDEAQAVRLANDTIYGLNASVFTNDHERAYVVARQLRSGTVGQNAFRTDFTLAFGGFKQSGFGREGGTDGLLPYLETKSVILDGKPALS